MSTKLYPTQIVLLNFMTNIGSTIWILEPDPKLGGYVKIGNVKLVAHLNFPALLQTGKMGIEAKPLHEILWSIPLPQSSLGY